jgi:hypothetical protein
VWFSYSPVLWPYTGYLAVYAVLADNAADADTLSGTAEGEISLEISSPPQACNPGLLSHVPVSHYGQWRAGE